jgi:hypothetical protein
MVGECRCFGGVVVVVAENEVSDVVTVTVSHFPATYIAEKRESVFCG